MDQHAKTPHISVVDDDALVREALKDCLESAGYEAETFQSAEDFLAAGAKQQIDCLILDIRLPGMSGIELQSRLGELHCRVPILFVTAHYSETLRAQAMRQGALGFMKKPFRRDELLSYVESALQPQ